MQCEINNFTQNVCSCGTKFTFRMLEMVFQGKRKGLFLGDILSRAGRGDES